MHLPRLILLACACLATAAGNAQSSLIRGDNLSADVSADGRLAIDLQGQVWVVPSGGGDAVQVTNAPDTAARPRWSPDSRQLVFQGIGDGQQGIWLVDVDAGTKQLLSDPLSLDIDPAWHPGGERIVYSAAADGRGFDLWELDTATQLRWRVSRRPGDEYDPAWSANGRDLVYVHRTADRWSLILRRHGQNEEVLLSDDEEILAPAWRPDGSLILYFQMRNGRPILNMVILAQPRLVRTLDDRERFDATSLTWADRHQFFYTANGFLRQRQFGAWRSRQIPFRAQPGPAAPAQKRRDRIPLPWLDEPTGELVIRAARLFDGINDGYRENMGIHIEGGRIVAVRPFENNSGKITIDLGDLVVLPGYIDADARLAGEVGPGHGPDLLTMGVTTIVATHKDADQLNALWSGKSVPGPRFLNATRWQVGPLAAVEADVTAAVSTSQTTGRVTGVSLPIQLQSMATAGLSPAQSLRAIGVNAAGALLADPFLGRIAVGAAADLVLVDGDPLTNPNDALNVVAVVRNGRFFSVSGLIDRAKSAESVGLFDN